RRRAAALQHARRGGSELPAGARARRARPRDRAVRRARARGLPRDARLLRGLPERSTVVSSPRRPAWSAAFEPDALPTLDRVGPLEQLTREWAWGGSTGAGVRVAVIDSGVDADHPAVGGNVEYAAILEKDGQIEVDTQPHKDDFGHGTACAGIIRSFAPD